VQQGSEIIRQYNALARHETYLEIVSPFQRPETEIQEQV
jgi:hypothetical protein